MAAAAPMDLVMMVDFAGAPKPRKAQAAGGSDGGELAAREGGLHGDA